MNNVRSGRRGCLSVCIIIPTVEIVKNFFSSTISSGDDRNGAEGYRTVSDNLALYPVVGERLPGQVSICERVGGRTN